MNNATNTTRVDTREILLNDTLNKSNIRVTRRTKMKELEKVQRLSSRSLRMIERMKKKNYKYK